jgi:hypothetical protein
MESKFMELLGHALEWFSVCAPLLGCACGWWLWAIAQKDASIPRWRSLSGFFGLILVTISIAFGAFAWIYWNRFAGHTTGPPEPTYVATLIGFFAGIVAIPISFCATSRTRVPLIFGCLGLAAFYFLMFLSP